MESRTPVAILLLGLAFLVGCSSTKNTTIHEAAAKPGSKLDSKKGQAIDGYVTRNGVYHEYEHGHVRLYTPDTLEFWRDEREEGYDGRWRTVDRHFVQRDSIHSIEARFASTGKTVGLVVGVTAVVVAVAAAIVASESCPLLYSYDGERYVLDGEPYGGATIRALERTDWTELEHLAPFQGSYRVLASNDMDETQHTNSLALLLVDHAPGSSVIMDTEGRPHAFSRMEPPSSARDESSNNLLPWLRQRDAVAWYPDLRTYSDRDTIDDTRNHILLEFPIPEDARHAYLVADVATGPWGSRMMRRMLDLRGTSVTGFYDVLNSSSLARRQLHDWNMREELYVLVPEVETVRGWERQAFLPGGGPVVGESRAIPLDLSGVTGPTLRVRIHPPIGFWTLNSFHLAWSETPVETREILPAHARQPSGQDVLAAIRTDDSTYVDFPEIGDRAELLFDAPAVAPGKKRTIFARTRGWYEIHLHDLGEPDAERIARLTNEPGYAVRMALREFGEYRRTEALLGAR